MEINDIELDCLLYKSDQCNDQQINPKWRWSLQCLRWPTNNCLSSCLLRPSECVRCSRHCLPPPNNLPSLGTSSSSSCRWPTKLGFLCVSLLLLLLLISYVRIISLCIRSPQREVISEKLHYQSAIFIRLFRKCI